MPLFDFECTSCHYRFESLVRTSEKDKTPECPKCGTSGKKVKRLVSKFAVGGQGDLRESTFHGCHDGFTGIKKHDH